MPGSLLATPDLRRIVPKHLEGTAGAVEVL
jgi:hypothetical protein